MRTFLAVMLCSSLAFADPPADAPTKCTEATTDTAPDVPGVSVKLKAGEPAPFAARALSLQENCERGQDKAFLQTFKDDASTQVMIPKPLLVTIITGVIILSAAAAAGVTYAADHKPPK